MFRFRAWLLFNVNFMELKVILTTMQYHVFLYIGTVCYIRQMFPGTAKIISRVTKNKNTQEVAITDKELWLWIPGQED